jgi:hypothetical protein
LEKLYKILDGEINFKFNEAKKIFLKNILWQEIIPEINAKNLNEIKKILK